MRGAFGEPFWATAALTSAREIYLDYVSTARIDRSEPVERDEHAQAEMHVPEQLSLVGRVEERRRPELARPADVVQERGRE